LRDELSHRPYRVVIVTLDAHSAGPAARVSARLARDFPGLRMDVFAAAEWGETPAALHAARAAIVEADIVVANLLFLEEHTAAILPDLQARREHCDAMVGLIADSSIVKLTRMGDLDMMKPASAAMQLLKSLKPSSKPSATSGAKTMKTLKRLPKILRLIPGKAQDL
jgi:magnesium chelatase subunit H